MPQITLRADATADGDHEETLTEYICDWPDCPNRGEYVLGVVVELRAFAAVCRDHARQLFRRKEQ